MFFVVGMIWVSIYEGEREEKGLIVLGSVRWIETLSVFVHIDMYDEEDVILLACSPILLDCCVCCAVVVMICYDL
jgi:hypothetical protein